MNWRVLALFACLGTVLVSAPAQQPLKNFPDIPDNHWAYEDIGQFERGRLVEPWLPMIRAGRPESRGDFADRIEYCFEKLVVMTGTTALEVKDAARPGRKDFGLMPSLLKHLGISGYASRWREPMHRLAKEFGPELRLQAIDVDGLLRRSDELISECSSFKMPSTERSSLPVIVPKEAQSASARFDDVPDNHWVIEDFRQFKIDGLTEEWWPYGGDGASMWPTRSDFADRTHYVYLQILDLAKDARTGDRFLVKNSRRAQTDGTNQESSFAVAQHASAWRVRMHRLINEFSLDLAALSFDMVKMRHDLDVAIDQCTRFALRAAGPATVQFRDVPAGHWAAQSTLDLRRAGILVGYPDGKFRG